MYKSSLACSNVSPSFVCPNLLSHHPISPLPDETVIHIRDSFAERIKRNVHSSTNKKGVLSNYPLRMRFIEISPGTRRSLGSGGRDLVVVRLVYV